MPMQVCSRSVGLDFNVRQYLDYKMLKKAVFMMEQVYAV